MTKVISSQLGCSVVECQLEGVVFLPVKIEAKENLKWIEGEDFRINYILIRAYEVDAKDIWSLYFHEKTASYFMTYMGVRGRQILGEL